MNSQNFILDVFGNCRTVRQNESFQDARRFFVKSPAYNIAVKAILKKYPDAKVGTIYLILGNKKEKEVVIMTLRPFSENRVFFLIEQLHKEFPEFGTLKVISWETQTVTARMGPPYTPSAREFKFKIAPGKDGQGDRLVYRGKRRVI